MSFVLGFLKWTLTLILGTLFTVLFVATLLIFRVNATFLEPDFYVEQLRKADIYNFMYDEAAPAILDELDLESQDFPVDLDQLKDVTLTATRKILPPQWVQAQVEQTLQELMPYFTGDAPDFQIAIPLADRIEAAGPVIKQTLRQGTTFNTVYNDLVNWGVDQALDEAGSLPFGLVLTHDDLVAAAEAAAPQDWLLDQANHFIDQIVPYLSGKSQHFTITIPIGQRVDPLASVVKDIVRQGDTYQFLIDEAVTPAVKSNLSKVVALPFGVSLTVDEIISAFKQVVSEQWVQTRLSEALDTMVDYLMGRTDTLQLSIPLADRKAVASEVLAGLADRKLEQFLASLPVCTLEELTRLAGAPLTQPTCRPPGLTYTQAKELLGIRIAPIVTEAIINKIPDRWLYTQEQMRSNLGEGSWQKVQDVRDWVRQGITFTDADLRRWVGPENEGRLDDVLDNLQNRFTVTQANLRERLAKEGPKEEDALRQFDQLRSAVHQIRSLLFLLPLLLVVLLTLIAFIRGRGWWGRLKVAAIFLIIASALVVGEAVALNWIAKDLVMNAIPQGDIPAVIVDKLKEMAINVAGDFLGGIRTQGIVLMIVGVILLVASILGPRALRRKKVAQAGPGSPIP